MTTRKREPRKTPPGVKPRPRKPRKITEAEMEYHSELVEKGAEAQEMRAQVAQHDAAWTAWGEHLFKKYGLSDADRIEPDGTIVRG